MMPGHNAAVAVNNADRVNAHFEAQFSVFLAGDSQALDHSAVEQNLDSSLDSSPNLDEILERSRVLATATDFSLNKVLHHDANDRLMRFALELWARYGKGFRDGLVKRRDFVQLLSVILRSLNVVLKRIDSIEVQMIRAFIGMQLFSMGDSRPALDFDWRRAPGAVFGRVYNAEGLATILKIDACIDSGFLYFVPSVSDISDEQIKHPSVIAGEWMAIFCRALFLQDQALSDKTVARFAYCIDRRIDDPVSDETRRAEIADESALKALQKFKENRRTLSDRDLNAVLYSSCNLEASPVPPIVLYSGLSESQAFDFSMGRNDVMHRALFASRMQRLDVLHDVHEAIFEQRLRYLEAKSEIEQQFWCSLIERGLADARGKEVLFLKNVPVLLEECRDSFGAIREGVDRIIKLRNAYEWRRTLRQPGEFNVNLEDETQLFEMETLCEELFYSTHRRRLALEKQLKRLEMALTSSHSGCLVSASRKKIASEYGVLAAEQYGQDTLTREGVNDRLMGFSLRLFRQALQYSESQRREDGFRACLFYARRAAQLVSSRAHCLVAGFIAAILDLQIEIYFPRTAARATVSPVSTLVSVGYFARSTFRGRIEGFFNPYGSFDSVKVWLISWFMDGFPVVVYSVDQDGGLFSRFPVLSDWLNMLGDCLVGQLRRYDQSLFSLLYQRMQSLCESGLSHNMADIVDEQGVWLRALQNRPMCDLDDQSVFTLDSPASAPGSSLC